MKIEIDLTDILCDDNGEYSETMAESIRRQVIETITKSASKDVKRQISESVQAVLDEELRKAVAEQMPSIVADLMNQPFAPVDRYGQRGKETTFRNELLNSIVEQMKYVPKTYDSDKNAFTKAVDATVSSHLNNFKSAFIKEVDGKFMKDAMQYAVSKLSERLKV